MSVFTNVVDVENVPLPIEGGNALPVTIDGNITVLNPGLTDTELRATPVPVSGSVSVSNFPATQPVSGTVAVTQSTSPWVVSGTVSTSPAVASNATVAQVVLTANTSTQLLAANAARQKVIIFLPTQPAYIKFGTTASNTSFTYKIVANNSTVEFGSYAGRVDILSQNGQTVNVTEVF